jgi:sigma-E processing peptidase SpoIIGA
VEIGGEPKREGYMTEYIYGDVLFVINFSMDFIALFICGKIMHFKMNFWRMALAATIGGVYGVASLFFELGTAGDILVDVLMAMALCFVAHYHGSTLKTFGVTALFAAVSMLMGGAMTALYSKIGKYQAYIQIGGTVQTVFGDIPFGVFACLAVVSACVTYVLQKLIHTKTSAKICTIRVTFDDGAYEFSAFVDTGNCAEDPISGTAVVFISAKAAGRIKGKSGELLLRAPGCVEGNEAKLVRFIPINTVSGYTLVSAVKPKKFEIAARHVFEVRNVLVACDTGASDFSGEEALVPSALL